MEEWKPSMHMLRIWYWNKISFFLLSNNFVKTVSIFCFFALFSLQLNQATGKGWCTFKELVGLAVFFLFVENSCGCRVSKLSFCSMQRWEGLGWEDHSAVEEFADGKGLYLHLRDFWNVLIMPREGAEWDEGGCRKHSSYTVLLSSLVFVSVVTSD